MIHLTICRAVRCPSCVTLLLCLVTWFCAAGIATAAVVGDQVELKARIRAGIPCQEPRGTRDFQRVLTARRPQSHGTRAGRPVAQAGLT